MSAALQANRDETAPVRQLRQESHQNLQQIFRQGREFLRAALGDIDKSVQNAILDA
jgi:hypothetical protein